MSPVIALLADDLTGAGDTGARFLRGGWSTELRLADAAASTAEVVAQSTDSRALPEREAASVVADRTRAMRAAGVRHLYKKIDSTLRGPLRAEIEAARTAWSQDAVAVVCPAFPSAGRTVRGGALLVDGAAVAETEFGSDPVTPVRESHLPTLLEAPGVRLEGDPARDAAVLAAAAPRVVVDAADEEELERIAAAIAHMGPAAIPVGSAGLAGPMARAWAAQARAAAALVVVTSLHRATRRQVEALTARRPAAVLRPEPEELRDETAWSRWCAAAHDRFAAAEELLVLLAPEGRTSGLGPAEVARRFGVLAADLAGGHPVAGFVATGGDGARALVAALGATGLALAGEIAPGVPVGTLTGGPAQGRPVVTKAGGFGDTDILIRAVTAVRQRRHRT